MIDWIPAGCPSPKPQPTRLTNGRCPAIRQEREGTVDARRRRSSQPFGAQPDPPRKEVEPQGGTVNSLTEGRVGSWRADELDQAARRT